ncbi:MAG: hypothetical protein PHV42_01765 [Candidatus Pacebacteria bacterium]|nr:hypothetical protein [Candidatus Paceibacterota bacterium]
MTQIMTASEMTDGQIDNLADKFRAALRKHRSDFDSKSVQHVLGVPNLGMEILAPFRKHMAVISKMMIESREGIDRMQSPSRLFETLQMNGKSLMYSSDRSVIDEMPVGEGKEVELYFFEPEPSSFDQDGCITEEKLAEEYEFRGLKPDPFAQMERNRAIAFADRFPNASVWKGKDGQWCSILFHPLARGLYAGTRFVSAVRGPRGWVAGGWFGGVRKW